MAQARGRFTVQRANALEGLDEETPPPPALGKMRLERPTTHHYVVEMLKGRVVFNHGDASSHARAVEQMKRGNRDPQYRHHGGVVAVISTSKTLPPVHASRAAAPPRGRA